MDKISRRKFLRDAVYWLGAGLAVSPGALQITRSQYPSYLKLYESGELARRAEQLYSIYSNCHLCPRDCRVNRLQGKTGKCLATAKVKVSSAVPHFGEEAPLVGQGGSGTIFFSNCNLRCVYCQNYSISLEGEGIEISDRRLSEAMIKLQKLGCHNINLVTPTHYLPNIVSAVKMAVEDGLHIPLD